MKRLSQINGLISANRLALANIETLKEEIRIIELKFNKQIDIYKELKNKFLTIKNYNISINSWKQEVTD